MKKGQYFSFDAIVASVIFVLALMALLSYWHGVRTYLGYQNNDIQKDSIRVSNLLFAPAYPDSAVDSSFDCDSIQRLGFSKKWDSKVLNYSFIVGAESCGTNQEWLKTRLATPYNVSVRISYVSSDLDDQLIGGDIPDIPLKEVVTMRRLATVVEDDGESHLARIDVRLYR